MKIDIRDYKGEKVIIPSGEIDMYSSPELRKKILNFTGQKISSLLVDFRDVSYIDSSGIATFVEGLKAMKPYGGRLKLVNMPENVSEIFRFSRLESVFEIYGSLDDAISRP